MTAKKVYEAKRIKRESSRACRDFSFKVRVQPLGLFSSRKKAEKAIAMCVRDFAAAADCEYGLAGFYVDEYALDRTLSAPDAWSSVREARWSYDKAGRPVSFSLFPTDWEDGRYSGTPPEAIAFKEGDWAWAHSRGRFVPARVLSPPFTPEEWKKRFGFASDASDDCYLVIEPGGHDHPPTTSLFPMDADVPGRIVAEVEAAEKEYLKGK